VTKFDREVKSLLIEKKDQNDLNESIEFDLIKVKK